MYCQTIPKVELHLHLGGSFPLEYLFSLASLEQRQSLERDLHWVSQRVPYRDVFRVFHLISQIVNTEEKIEKGTTALCLALAADGVIYAEIRTGLKDLGQGQEAYLQSVLKGIREGVSAHFHARLLLSLQRSSSAQQAKKTVDLALKYRHQGVVGIDISGDSTAGQIETIIPELLRAKREGLFLALHMGESPDEKNQRETLECLQPDRIGHGVHLTEEALQWIFEHRVPIEVCPSSSVLVQMVDRYEAHPGLHYYSLGHPIAIATDNPALFSTSLSEEFALLCDHASFSFEKVKEMALLSLDYAFISEEEKMTLRRRFE